MEEKNYYVISIIMCHWDYGYGEDDRWESPSFIYYGTEKEVNDLVNRYNSVWSELTEFSGLEEFRLCYCKVSNVSTQNYTLIDHLLVEAAFEDSDWEHPEIVSRIAKFKTALNSIHD